MSHFVNNMKLRTSKFRKHRVKFGITITEVARKADLSTRTISRIEKADGNIKEESLYRALRALNDLSDTKISFEEVFYLE